MKNQRQQRGLSATTLWITLAAAAIVSTPLAAQTGKSGRSAVVPGQIGKARDGIVYGISRGETLSAIAQRFTGNPRHWVEIGRANGISNDRTIPVGTSIAIPARLLPEQNAFATIVAVQGEISILTREGDVVTAKAGVRLAEGTLVATADDGFVTLSLQDGTSFALPPASTVQLSKLQVQRYTDRPRTALSLQKGRVTSQVTPFTTIGSQYEVQTPLAIAGVRGTRFRINYEGSRSYNEVLEGTVRVAADGKPASTDVKAAFGAIVGSGRKVSAPVPLLAPPQLQLQLAEENLPVQQRLPLRFEVAQAQASAFRVGIFSDEQGLQQVAETRVDNPAGNTSAVQARIAELADGDYYVHAAAIDRDGLEGRETVRKFRLKARPFAPFQQAPGAKVRGPADGNPATVQFRWTDVGNGASYHLQIASDAGFGQLLEDRPALAGTEYSSTALTQGRYFWRIATVVMKDGVADQGPWSDVRELQLLAPQQAPEVSQEDGRMRFAWRGEAGQRFVFETAADASFSQVLQHAQTSAAQVELPLPPAGVYYARLQGIDADGFEGAFSPPQKFIVERRWSTGSGGALQAGGVPVRGN